MGRALKPKRADWSDDTRKQQQVGVSDMTLLSKITNEEINENLKKRHQNGNIYTYIGNVLISVNPFKDLGIYTNEILQSYRGKNKLELPPHVFAIAEDAFKNMLAYKENQCVIISGESGAGKTEAAKKIMQYIAAVSGGENNSSSITKIKDMVLATNPLLESFGCAKTLRNNNSSRHGKYLEIMFNFQGAPVGALITNYLLEKNRVVSQTRDERNFHIFYQFTKAASQEYRDMFGISGPENYSYTSQAGCLDVQNINDVSDYAETIKAMDVIGISNDDRMNIHRILATILWLGNVQFAEDDNSASYITDDNVVQFLAYLFESPAELVKKALVTRTIETPRAGRRGSVYEIPLNPTQATAVRNALAQTLYDRLFDWIVCRVNKSLVTHSNGEYSIGVLDIYGFEIFENNSFEQLCINYVNEKLQQIFIELTLKAEQEEYVREQIEWTPIKYFNNKIVCDLIEAKRPPGIFSAMNDACATAHADSSAADNSFRQRLNGCTSNRHLELLDVNFTIKHYAGNVTYTIEGMTDKNKDQMQKDLLELCKGSQNTFLRNLFPEPVNPDTKKRPPTASDRIKVSANELFTKLMQCQPSYIRTIKPNENKSPVEYDNYRVQHQVKYLGLCENIRVRRAGFAYRQTFDKVVERFYLLSPATSYAGDFTWKGDSKSACAQIFKDTKIDPSEWQLGVTKAFIRHPETLWALESQRERYWHNMATRIQRSWAKFMAHKHECAAKVQQAWSISRDRHRHIREREEARSMLGGRKERRRYSLLSTRTFYGDYFGVRGPNGNLIRDITGIQETDAVLFSTRGQTLVARKMRSAKPGPRIFVLTPQNLYVVSQSLDQNGVLTNNLEQQVPLVSIGQISMSPYQDGWVVLHINSSPDIVARIDFKTEFMFRLVKASGKRIQVNIAPTVQYNNKNMKATSIKFEKGSTTMFETFEKKVVRVSQGMPPNSESNPSTRPPIDTSAASRITRPPRRAPQQSVNASSGYSARPAQGNSDPTSMAVRQQHAIAAAVSTITPSQPVTNTHKPAQAPSAVNNTPIRTPASHTQQRKVPQAPPPPPPPPAVERLPRCKALYDFPASENNIELVESAIYEIVEKNSSGWWLARQMGRTEEGWIPSNYVEEVAAVDDEPPKPQRPIPNGNNIGSSAASSNTSAGRFTNSSSTLAPQNRQAANNNSQVYGTNSMAELAAALANRPKSPNGGTIKSQFNPAGANARPGYASNRPIFNNRPNIEDSDDEWD
ncbi:class II myosin [Mycoemilia scoparia]|uniref:Class II myosin n=1 Tax=Mycoemilia scoparia TaxID=417184 RepID=A0A9W8A061_9FUNG|nr:class II myosin [Mycoemilia scoparia]